jgi:hypothetical protein
MSNADAVRSAAVEYVAHGWRIVPLPPGKKGPTAAGWQLRENTIGTVERASRVSGGIGLAHAYSGTCALDIDDWDAANAWLAERGVDLSKLWGADDAVRLVSGRPGRGKLLYALPAPLRSLRPEGSGLELRCASANGATVQDVLPPSIHPDTGKPYSWAGRGDWRALPPLPQELEAVWVDILDSDREPADSDVEPVGMTEQQQWEVLSRLDPNCGYHEWIKVGMALHHENAGEDRGFGLWDSWSIAGHSYPGTDKLRQHWDSFGHGSGPVVTMRSLGQVASADLFDVVDAEEDEPERFRFIPAPEYAARTEPGWIVKGVLPRAGLAVAYGDSGAGKTFVVLDVVGAIVRGEPWRGHKVTQGKVAYICAEGAEFFSRRIRAYSKHTGSNLEQLFVCSDSPNFLNDNDHKLIARALAEVKPSVIVVDTLARTMPGGAENSSEDMGKVIARCQWLHHKTGALVLLVHHSGKDAARGARGWSGLRAAADAELVVTRDKENDRRAVEIGKQKDSPDGSQYDFVLRPVPLGFDDDGDVITSCVIEEPPQDLSVEEQL